MTNPAECGVDVSPRTSFARPVIRALPLALAGSASLACGRARRNRRRYGPSRGLRVAALHAEDTIDLDRFKRWIEWCGARMPFASPEVVERGIVGPNDALLITMDDGDARTFPAVEWLATAGIRIIYFVVPSYVGRTCAEFLAYHRQRGVSAFNIAARPDRSAARGFERSQLLELEHMGHRIGAHNDAHRSLGRLAAADAAYDIDGALDRLSDLLGHPIDDFAWAFGTLSAISPESLAMIRRRCARVYSCIRGLNVPHVTSSIILRDAISVETPFVFTRACLQGAFDDRSASDREALVRLTGHLRVAA